MARWFANRSFAILGVYCIAAIVFSSLLALWLATGERSLAVPSGISQEARDTSSNSIQKDRDTSINSKQDYRDTSSNSTQEDRNTSNIDRKQYETAMAKWKSLHISEYEATVRVSHSANGKVTRQG